MPYLIKASAAQTRQELIRFSELLRVGILQGIINTFRLFDFSSTIGDFIEDCVDIAFFLTPV